MEFHRRKVKGRSRETYKEWVSDCGFFRITWINENGFKHYHACVKVEGDRWEFAHRRGPHKTFKKAVESCEKNKRLWDAFVKLSHSPGRRDGKLLELKLRAPAIFFNLPLWVREQAEPGLVRMLLCPVKEHLDPSEASKTSEPPTGSSPSAKTSEPTPPSGPAPVAAEEAGITTPMTAAPSKATSSRRATRAKPAKEPDEAPAKPSKRSTTKSSTSSESSSPKRKKRKGTAAADSASSPAKRKKR